MPRPSVAPLVPADVRRVAVLADVDPRTVASYIDGKRSTVQHIARAVEKALRKIGRADLVRSGASAAA